MVRAKHQAGDVAGVVRALVGVNLSPGQAEIAGLVVGKDRPARATVRAPTQYGKTFGVGKGCAADLVLDPEPTTTAVIGPRKTQASLIRNEFIDAVLRCPPARHLLGLGSHRDVEDRMRRELSRSGVDFRDGKRFGIFSAADDGDALMGFGAKRVIVDETGLIARSVKAKIMRMVGKDPDSIGQVILVSNPWSVDSWFYDACQDPAYQHVHVTLEQAVAEKRLNPALVAEMERDLSTAEFDVLYKSVFPQASADALIPWNWILDCVQNGPRLEPDTEGVYKVWGLDVAEGGDDFTVLTEALTDDESFDVLDQTHWQFDDTTRTTDKVFDMIGPGAIISVDMIGPGKGVGDGLRRRGCHVRPFKASEGARNKERFRIRKYEQWWSFRELCERRGIRFADKLARLRTDLAKMRYRTDRGRVEVFEEPGKSPDWGDSAMHMLTAKMPPRGRVA